ncbi:MAG: Transglycosylase domain [Chthonomonadaceae bacterium]|nr:Transglycosylase domain [Chthonomonadaceae bacterium]
MLKKLEWASMELNRLTILGTVGAASLASLIGSGRPTTTPPRVTSGSLSTASIRSSASSRARLKDPALPRIASLVHTLRPEKGRKFAWSVAADIVQSARENRVSPYVVSATAVVESEFDMNAGPCVGVMQIYPSTVTEVYANSNRDPYGIQDNIWMGSNYLARHYRSELACRSGSEEVRLSRMWGSYNGAGPGSVYAQRALRVLHRIKTGNPKTWKQTIRTTGSLWGVQPLKTADS